MSQRKRVNFQHGMARHLRNILKQAQTFEDNAPPGIANELHNKYNHLSDDYESDKKQNVKRVFHTSNLRNRTKLNHDLNHYDNAYHPAKKMKTEQHHKADASPPSPVTGRNNKTTVFASRAIDSQQKEDKIDNSYGGQLLQKALSKFSSRGVVLLIEQEIERFVTYCVYNCSAGNYVLLFPPCNGYYRLLIHHIAQRFGCITKSYGDGENRRVIIYCNIDSKHSKQEISTSLLSVPAKLKDVYGFLPILMLSDLFAHKYQESVTQSKQYYIDWLEPNASSTWNDIVLQKVDIDVEGLSHDIVCEHAMFVYYEWDQLFRDNSDGSWKKESDDIDAQDIGCSHMLEIQCKEPNNGKWMKLFIDFVKGSIGNKYDNAVEMRQIDTCYGLILLCDMLQSDVTSLVKKFYSEYCLYQNRIRVRSMGKASDVTKYFSGFVSMIMNKKRGTRDTTVAKRMIAHALTGSVKK